MHALTDERLVARAQAGNELAKAVVCKRYDRVATGIALDFFLPGADIPDVKQEARIGVLKAIRSFDPAAKTLFAVFVGGCIRRHVISAVRGSQRLKHRVLTESVRIATSEIGEPIEVVDLLPSTFCLDPHEMLVAKERFLAMLAGIRALSPRERRSLLGVTNGLTYSELSAALGITEKSIDNAVQRARRQLREVA